MNYKEIIENVLANGTPKQAVRFDNDGNIVPVENGTIGTFCEIFRHDMSKGFPLTTLRKMAFKSMCVELEGFIKGITSKKWYQERGCNFWNEWANPVEVEKHQYMLEFSYDETMSREEAEQEYQARKKAAQKEVDDLGEIYGFLWRCFPSDKDLVQVYPKSTTYSCTGIIEYKKKDYLTDLPDNHEFYGRTFSTRSGKFIVESIYKKKGYKGRYVIRFILTGYKKIVQKSQIISGNILDPTGINVCGVASHDGFYKNNKNNFEQIIYKNWYDMINRCYNPKSSQYSWYGKKGVVVCDRWLHYSNYRYDITKINGWQNKLRHPNVYSLDKDYYNSGVYAPDTCVFLHEKENKIYNSCVPVEISKNGKLYRCINYSEAAKIIGCTRRAIPQAIYDDRNCKGWKCVKLGGLWRYTLPKDQIKEIVNKLKKNPHDRRMVCSAWNPTNFDKIALHSCHYCFSVVVYGNKLNLCWKQRSCDLMLGVGINIASYGMLQLLLCEESGLEPGELVGVLEDCHIYDNLKPATLELVKRDEKDLPEVKVKRKEDGSFSIFDWSYDEVELQGYNPHPKLNMGQVTV